MESLIKLLSALQKKLQAVRCLCRKHLKLINYIVHIMFGLLFFISVMLATLYVRHLQFKFQTKMGMLKEAIDGFPLYRTSGIWYKFPLHSSGVFEFSGGQLRVNTTLYAW